MSLPLIQCVYEASSNIPVLSTSSSSNENLTPEQQKLATSLINNPLSRAIIPGFKETIGGENEHTRAIVKCLQDNKKCHKKIKGGENKHIYNSLLPLIMRKKHVSEKDARIIRAILKNKHPNSSISELENIINNKNLLNKNLVNFKLIKSKIK